MLRYLLVPLLAALPAFAQTEAPSPAPSVSQPSPDKPLPDIPTLMHLVETHQRADEAILKEYTYRNAVRFDKTDSHGNPKKTDTSLSDIFWLKGVPVRRVLSKDGKPLTPDEEKKESDRIDKEVDEAIKKRGKAEDQGKDTNARGDDIVTVSRMLELGQFTSPRRILVAGRPTILVDFTGDPKAKTRNRAESAIHDMAGLVAIDEQDAEIQHLEGQFIRDFKIGGGLVASVSKGTSFAATNARINNEVWLPQSFEAHGHARYLLFFSLEGNIQARQSQYRKFRATTTILPDFTKEEPTPEPK